MSIAADVWTHFMRAPIHTIVTRRELLNIGNHDAIDQALMRLRRNKKITRLAAGLYIRPKIGAPMPSVLEIAATRIKAFNRQAELSGEEEARRFGLSESGDVTLTYEVNSSSSAFIVLPTPGRPAVLVLLRRRAARKIELAKTTARRAIKAIWALKECKQEFIAKLWQGFGRIEKQEFRESHRWMPNWLSNFVHQAFPPLLLVTPAQVRWMEE